MSDEFDSSDAIEKTGAKRALNRCCALARQIESELRNQRPEHFVDKVALAELYAFLERAADIVGRKNRQLLESTPAPAVKDAQARGRQRQR